MNSSSAFATPVVANNNQQVLSDLITALEQTNLYSFISQIATVYGFPPVKGGMDAVL
ncbi:hypothetical protein LJ864_002714, partial [Salmonella enterica]|nr:hypothetical protein [Salmonella enterica]